MTIIEVTEPHGYLLDSDGRVVQRFKDWSIRKHDVGDTVATVEYVDSPNAHSKSVHNDYRTNQVVVRITTQMI